MYVADIQKHKKIMALNIEVEGTGGIQELALIKHRPMCCTVHYRSIRCFSKQKNRCSLWYCVGILCR